MLDLELTNAVVAITGGASGIGAACAEAACAQGAAVIILDRDRVGGTALAERLAQAGHAALFVATDVANDAAMATAMTAAGTWRGCIDSLICCAGISGPVGKPVTEIRDADWQSVLAVNLGGLFHTSKYALPLLERSAVATLVIIASDSSYLAYPGMAAYSASKGGALMLTRALAVDHPRVRVNCLCPSVVDTPMSRRDLGLTGDEIARAGFPVIASERIATHALFLASPVSSPINGTSLVVDFGFMARPAFPQPEFADAPPEGSRVAHKEATGLADN
ncbi:MAG TPA: SDR family oxidoreductase [Acidiphilium sp.]